MSSGHSSDRLTADCASPPGRGYLEPAKGERGKLVIIPVLVIDSSLWPKLAIWLASRSSLPGLGYCPARERGLYLSAPRSASESQTSKSASTDRHNEL